ncbi:MAG: hypothetical protein U1E76_24830 [Planctomycetota bacterium]
MIDPAYEYSPPASHPPGRGAWIALERRGVHHGYVRERCRTTTPAIPRRWHDAEAIVLRAVLPVGAARATIARSVAHFRAFGRGAGLQPMVARQLVRAPPLFRLAGVSQDVFDPREIEKVYVDAWRGGRCVARGLYAKLSWVARETDDRSLRVRCSFGSEHLLDWRRDPVRATWSDRYAECLFPEARLITGNRRVTSLLTRLTRGRVRLSERIIYANAPGGGAVFHHDAEPGQKGVIYGQMAGATAWLAISKRSLAAVVAQHAASRPLRRSAGTQAKALRALAERTDWDPLHRLLNATPSFTRALVERGACIVLHPGDVLLLPSHGPDDATWHSVFGIGRRPSLAHSYGLFARSSS